MGNKAELQKIQSVIESKQEEKEKCEKKIFQLKNIKKNANLRIKQGIKSTYKRRKRANGNYILQRRKFEVYWRKSESHALGNREKEGYNFRKAKKYFRK